MVNSNLFHLSGDRLHAEVDYLSTAMFLGQQDEGGEMVMGEFTLNSPTCVYRKGR